MSPACGKSDDQPDEPETYKYSMYFDQETVPKGMPILWKGQAVGAVEITMEKNSDGTEMNRAFIELPKEWKEELGTESLRLGVQTPCG